jgi:hypothetical protein
MKLQLDSKRGAAVLFAAFVVAFAPIPSAKSAAPQTTAKSVHETDEQQQGAAQSDHEAEEQLQRAAAKAAHEAEEEQQRAARAAHEADEQLQREAAKAAHEAEEDQQRAAQAAHEAQEEQQRAAAKAAHEAEEQQQRLAQAASEALEHQPAMEITVVGCVVKEKNWRKEHHSGKGGFDGSGIGLGNEYILVHASRITNDSPEPAVKNCADNAGGDTYELTGGGEGKVEHFYGHRVEITGKLKKAEITPETRGTNHPQPTGGKDLLKQDLRLFEINVATVRDYVPPVVAYVAPPRIEPQAAVIEPSPVAAPEPEQELEVVATTGRETLPKTGSSMPLVGLLGLFFFAAAIALRFVRGVNHRVRL